MAAPCMSIIFERAFSKRVTSILAMLFLCQSTLWLFHNYTRPIIASKNILNTSRQEQYFMNRPELQEQYVAVSQKILAADAQNVGLMIQENDWEYPLWMLTEALSRGIQIRHTHIGNISSSLENTHTPYDVLVTVTEEDDQRLLEILE
jgi:hypothetical protein